MGGTADVEINTDLFTALTDLLPVPPTTAVPVVVLAAYLHDLAKGYGLSDSEDLPESRVDQAKPPAQAEPFFLHHLPEAVTADAPALRQRLYAVLLDLADDATARRALNKNEPLTDQGLLTVAQVFWNLESSPDTPRLPIPAGQEVTTRNGGTKRALIRVPGAHRDFATMNWTQRINEGVTGLGAGPAHKTSGQGFRTKGARLAVLIAQRLVQAAPQPSPDPGCVLQRAPGTGKPKATLLWQDTQAAPPNPAPALCEPAIDLDNRPGAPTAPASATTATDPARPATGWPVVIGTLAEVGIYQRRAFDDQIDQLWADGGDRRVWLRGAPGLGKTYTARRIMHEALARTADDREELLVWVDSADAESVTRALTQASEQMGGLGPTAGSPHHDSSLRARALLTEMATSTWRWLIILDNADAASLMESGLLPPGMNPNGRVLVTTVDRDHRCVHNGRVVDAELFTAHEADAFLRAQLDPVNGQPAALAAAAPHTAAELAATVGHHPLALSIAAATIVVHSMDVADWITEFRHAEAMDATADEPDAGGYPHLIGATWQTALAKASRGLPDGVTERAAIVAAVQDPDGHPTWLWDSEPVTTWVTGGTTLPRRHGIPEVVRALIDHGILELIGTWKNGTLTIHQLAARAVQERASATDLTALAGLLADEWLLRLTKNDAPSRSTLRRNLERLQALPGLTPVTEQTLTAILEHVRQGSRDYQDMSQINAGIARLMENGGLTADRHTAHRLLGLGEAADEIGRTEEARAFYEQAAERYERLITNGGQDEPDLLDHLRTLGQLYSLLGDDDRARTAYSESVRLREQEPQDTEAHWLDKWEDLIEIAELRAALGDADAAQAACLRAERLLDAATDDQLESEIAAADSFARRRGAKALRRLGRLNSAVRVLRCLVRAQRAKAEEPDVALLRQLGLAEAAVGQWGAAEKTLDLVAQGRRATPSDLVLLASVQLHLDDVAKARAAIALAAAAATERNSEEGAISDPGEAWHEQIARLVARSAVADAMGDQRWEDAVGILEKVRDRHQEITDQDPGEVESERDLASAHYQLGVSLFMGGRLAEAVEPLTRAAAAYRVMADLDPEDERALGEEADAQVMLATCARAQRADHATGHLIRAVELVGKIADPSTEDLAVLRGSAGRLSMIGAVASGLGEWEHAKKCFSREVRLRKTIAELVQPSIAALRGLAEAEYELGRAYVNLGRLRKAESWLKGAVEKLQAITYENWGEGELSAALAEALEMLGFVRMLAERVEDAEPVYERAVEIRRTLADANPTDFEAQSNLGISLGLLGAVYKIRGRLPEAADCSSRAANVLLLLVDVGHITRDDQVKSIFSMLTELASLLNSIGRFDDAAVAAARADDIAKRFPGAGETG